MFAGVAEADGVGTRSGRKGLEEEFGFEWERARGVDVMGVEMGFVKLGKISK